MFRNGVSTPAHVSECRQPAMHTMVSTSKNYITHVKIDKLFIWPIIMKRKFLLTQILYLVVLFEAGFTFSGTHCTYKNWFLTSVIASWEWRHRRMLEISNLEKRSKKEVALKHGQGSTYYDIKWVKAAFSSTLARKALFFFPFPPGVPIWFKSADGLASSLGSSSVLLVQNESATIMPARMCLTFCAQTLVPTQTIRRLSHLTVDSLFHIFSQHGAWDWGCVPWASDSSRKAKTGQATWC